MIELQDRSREQNRSICSRNIPCDSNSVPDRNLRTSNAKGITIQRLHQSSPLGPQGSTASDSVSRDLEHPRVELCWQWNRSTYLFLAAAGFDFLARTALAAIVASSFGSQLAGGCRHVLRKLSIEREESTYWFRYRSMSGSGTDHAADVERVGKNLIYQIDGDQGLFNPFRRLEFSFKPGGT